jgi:hypothetical protein
VLPVRYRLDNGVPLISVTQILGLAGRIDSQWFTPESARRGQIVHDLTEVFDRGDPLEVPPDLMGYIEAYTAFVATVRPVYVESEVRVTNAALGVGGRIDRVCGDLWGAPGILDFKTGDPQPWHGSQLAFYNFLRPTGPRWGCYLGANGRFKLKQYDDPNDHRQNMYDLAQVRGTICASGDYWVPRC